MQQINFKSSDFTKYIMNILQKEDNDIIEIGEIREITTVVMNAKGLRGEFLDLTIEDLLYFQNLKICFIKNMKISDIQINFLNQITNLEEIQFHNCEFLVKKQKLTQNIKRITIIDCYNFKINLLTKLEQLKILMLRQREVINLKNIKKLINLEKLYLQEIPNLELSFLNKLNNLILLNIEDSKLKYEDEIEKYKLNVKIEGTTKV